MPHGKVNSDFVKKPWETSHRSTGPRISDSLRKTGVTDVETVSDIGGVYPAVSSGDRAGSAGIRCRIPVDGSCGIVGGRDGNRFGSRGPQSKHPSCHVTSMAEPCDRIGHGFRDRQ